MSEGIYSKGKKLLDKKEESSILKSDLETELQRVKAETEQRKHDLNELSKLMKQVLQIDIENGLLENEIRLLIKQYLERKLR